MTTKQTKQEKKRWHVVVEYGGHGIDRFDVEELFELHDIIEHGPDWNTISEIKITLNRGEAA